MTKYYLKYSTTRNVDRCKKAVDLVNKYDKGVKIWQKHVEANNLDDHTMPILELIEDPDTFTAGDDVLDEIAKMYDVNLEREFAEPSKAVEEVSPPQTAAQQVVPQPPINSELPTMDMPVVPTQPLIQPPSEPIPAPTPTPAPPPAPALPRRVKPQYVLYTADDPQDVVIPANGYVQMIDYDAYRMNFDKKMAPKWLAEPKALPILATIGEDKPTLLHGQFAKDFCKVLCLFNDGPARM